MPVVFASTFVIASLIFIVCADQTCRDPYANQTIEWVACATKNQPTLECGTIEVPIDYTDLSTGSFDLAVVRIPALGSSPRGSIFTNPGGPGISGIESVVGIGDVLQEIVGTDFHIVGWDPRGVGLTTPYECSSVEALPGNGLPLETPEGLNATYVYNVNQAQHCAQTDYEASTLIGTAFTARDAMAIVDALGEDGMMRYWGFSYGTLLGATMAAMFPDRIDRMILDGNINPTDYYHGLNSESVDNVDAAVSHFFEMCASAGSQYCALADDYATGQEMEQYYLDFLAGYANGLYVFTDATEKQWSYVDVKGYLYNNLKSPSAWGVIAQGISNFYSAMSSPAMIKRDSPFNPLDANSDPNNTYATLAGITCSDWDDVPADGTLQDFADWLKLYQARSSFGGDQLISILYSCAVWTINAKEKYTGSFENIKTKNPIFFINGHFDPLTPLVSAQNSSSGFIGSGLLNTNIAGHCSTAQPSKCVNDKVASYFDTGKLPDLTEICNPDTPAFLPDNSTTTAKLLARFEQDRGFEYPAAVQHLKRSFRDMLVEKRASTSALPNCTSFATGAGSTVYATPRPSSHGEHNGAAGRHLDAGVLGLSCLVVMMIAATLLH